MKKLALIAAASTLFIAGTAFAGTGGNITIDNQSSYTMYRKIINKGTMHSWLFPDNIEKTASFYVEFCFWKSPHAEADYEVTCPNGEKDTIQFHGVDYDAVTMTEVSVGHCVKYDTHGHDDNIFVHNTKVPAGYTVTIENTN